MATYTIGTASGGYYNFRGTNNPPYSFGSSVSGLGNAVINSFSIQLASNSGTGTVYGCIWNSAGNLVWNSGATSVGLDTSAPFGAVGWSPGIYLANDTYYFGFSKAAGSSINWDVVNGNNTTITGSATLGSISTSGTGTIYRRLVGSIDYTNVSAPTMSFASASANVGYNDVSWGASSNGGLGIYQYNVYRNNDPNQLIYSGTGTSLTDSRPAGASTYYVVYAYNAVGASNAAVSNTVTTPNVPNAPASLSGTGGVMQVSLAWTAPSSNNGSAVSSYTLKRDGSQIYSGTATSYVDTGLAANTTYNYSITATNAVGESSATLVSATTLGGLVRVWNGTSYVANLPKVWNGTAWVVANARVWNGTAWVYGA